MILIVGLFIAWGIVGVWFWDHDLIARNSKNRISNMKYLVAGICSLVVGILVGGTGVVYYLARGMFRNF